MLPNIREPLSQTRIKSNTRINLEQFWPLYIKSCFFILYFEWWKAQRSHWNVCYSALRFTLTICPSRKYNKDKHHRHWGHSVSWLIFFFQTNSGRLISPQKDWEHFSYLAEPQLWDMSRVAEIRKDNLAQLFIFITSALSLSLSHTDKKTTLPICWVHPLLLSEDWDQSSQLVSW